MRIPVGFLRKIVDARATSLTLTMLAVYALSACGSGKAGVVGPSAAPAPTTPSYLQLRPGQRSYLDTNAEGDFRHGTLFNDWPTVVKWAQGHYDHPDELAHVDLPVGTEVVVESWKSIQIAKDEHLIVFVQAIHGHSHGYVDDVMLIPKIPKGAILIARGADFHDKDAKAPLERTADGSDNPIKLIAGTRVELVSEVHDERLADSLVSMFQVRVLEGPHKGAIGFLGHLSTGIPSEKIDSSEYVPECKCVTSYLLDVPVAAN